MIFAIELERCVTSTGILSIIINKFRYKKKSYLIILLKVNKNLEVSFYHTILPFNLAVCLQVKGNKEFLFDVKEII